MTNDLKDYIYSPPLPSAEELMQSEWFSEYESIFLIFLEAIMEWFRFILYKSKSLPDPSKSPGVKSCGTPSMTTPNVPSPVDLKNALWPDLENGEMDFDELEPGSAP